MNLSSYLPPRLLAALEKFAKDPAPGWKLARGCFLFAACYLLVLAAHWPYRALPLWGDCLGYMITNTDYMVKEGSIFQPVDHDTGHPPVAFWSQAIAWQLAGQSILVIHRVQYIWAALLIAGLWKLGRLFAPGSRWPAAWMAAAGLLFPQFFTIHNQIIPEGAQLAFFVWVIHGFYARRPVVYVAALAIFPLTKANSLPLLFFFALAEFIIAPAARAFMIRQDREQLTALARDWGRWVGLSWLASIPFLLWCTVKYLDRGFILTGPNFPESTKLIFEWEYFWESFFGGSTWHSIESTHYDDWVVLFLGGCFGVAGWWLATRPSGQGTKQTRAAAVGAALLLTIVAASWYTRTHGDAVYVLLPVAALLLFLPLAFGREENPVAAILRGEQTGLRRPAPAFVGLVLIIATGMFVLYTFKELKLARFYTVVAFCLIICTGVVWALVLQLLARTGRPAAVHALGAALLALIAGGNTLRLYPEFLRDELPGPLRRWYEPRLVQNYDMDMQIAPFLMDMRKAIEWLEKRALEEPDKTLVVGTTWPGDRALLYPQGGHRRGSEAKLFPILLHNDWAMYRAEMDYMLFSPMLTPPAHDDPSPEWLERRGLEIVWARTYEDSIWPQHGIYIYKVGRQE